MPDRGRRRWSGTVRLRVTAVATLAVAVVLIVTGLLLVAAQRRVLGEQLDEALAADADRIVAQYTGDPDSVSGDLDPAGDDDAVAQLVTLDGGVIARSPNAPDAPVGVVPDERGDRYATRRGIGVDDEEYRVLSRRFAAASGDDDLIVILGSPRDDINDAVHSLAVALWVGVPAVTVILAGLIWLMVGRTLRPVERIRAEVAAIGPAELGRRVPEPAGGDEIARLANTMNAMLDRLDSSAQRQRQFTADASHELRTPLTRLRAEIEIEQRERDEPFVRSLLDEVEGMQRLIDDLLVLARGDEESDAAHRRPVDLDDIVLEEVGALDSNGVVVDASRVSGAQVRGAPEQLRRVVRNLLDNAVYHASSRVTVSLEENSASVVLAVADDGPGIPPEHEHEVFERFRRLDQARSSAGGTGLGLAIAREVVVRHGGTITIDGDHRPGARFVVTFQRDET